MLENVLIRIIKKKSNLLLGQVQYFSKFTSATADRVVPCCIPGSRNSGLLEHCYLARSKKDTFYLTKNNFQKYIHNTDDTTLMYKNKF